MFKSHFKFIAVLVLMSFSGSFAYAVNDDEVNPPVANSDSQYSNLAPPEIQPAASVGAGWAEKVTLDLKGVNVLDVLKILAKRSGLNIVAGRDVRGDVTLYMQNVQVRNALDTIVKTLGLAYDEKDGIVTVMSDKEYSGRNGKPFRDTRVTETFHMKHANPQIMNQLLPQMKSPLGKLAIDERTATFIVTDNPEVIKEMRKAVEEFDQPLTTKVFTLKYGKAADVGEQLKDYLSPNVGIEKVDERSNQVSVTDREEVVSQISDLINAFDIRPQQVLIDAKVVEVQLYDAFRYGIDWNYVGLKVAEMRDIQLRSAQTVSAPVSALGGGTLSTFTIGQDGTDKFQSVVSILQNLGKTNILSSPRLLCLNNEEAKLAVATKQPYVTQTVNITTASSNTADDVKFVDVGVTLSIIPTIAPDGNVVLKVKPEVSSSNSTFTIQGVAQGSNTLFDRTKVPIVTSQTIETTVVAKNGETVVIGGLIQNREAKIRKKFPVLGDIPFVGAAFRTESNDFNKTELVVFLTPHVVTGETSSLEERKYLNQEGDLIDFNKVGGYDFTKGENTSSQGFFRMNDKEYYETPVKERPVYFPSKNTAIEAAEYGDKHNLYAKNPKSEEDTVQEESVKPVVVQTVAPPPALPQQESKAEVKPEVKETPAPIVPVVKEKPKPEIKVETKAADKPVVVAELKKEIPAQEAAFNSPNQARRHYRESVAAAIMDALNLHHDLGKYPMSVKVFLIIERDGQLTAKQIVSGVGLTPGGRATIIETLQKLSPFPPFPSDMGSDRELVDLTLDLK